MFIEKEVHADIVRNNSMHPMTKYYAERFEQIDNFGACLLTHQQAGDESADIHNRLTRLYSRIDSAGAFYFSKNFLNAMKKIDKKIPFSYMPSSMLMYIQFPEDYFFDGEDYVDGAYIFSGHSDAIDAHGEKFEDTDIFTISYVCKGWQTMGSLLIRTDESDKLSSILGDYPCMSYDHKLGKFVDSEELLSPREIIFRTIINSILYISCSNDAEALLVPPQKRPHNKKVKKLKKRKGICNFSNTSFFYIDDSSLTKIINYSKDKTSVTGHLRWQPHGHNREKLKLIWIKEHQRCYNKSVKEDIIVG